MIEDLDVIVEPAPTVRDRWLLPGLAMIALTAVLVVSFVRLAPARSVVLAAPVSRPSVLEGLPPATGIRTLELPRTLATLQVRTQISGVTGLASMDLSDGFRDVYRFADGRLLIVVEYPDTVRRSPAPPANASQPDHRLAVRGTMGIGYETATASLPVAIAWWSDAMQYVMGGAGFTEDQLVQLASQLR